MKNHKTYLIFALLFIPLLIGGQAAFAGHPYAQGGDPIDDCSVRPENKPHCPGYNPVPTPKPLSEQRSFAAAQLSAGRDLPPGAGPLRGGESETRTNVSFFLSLIVLGGGIWALITLARHRITARSGNHRSRGLRLAFKPQFALAVFGTLFTAAIIASILTEPTTVGAQRRVAVASRNSHHDPNRKRKSQMTGIMNPANKAVFKSAQAIGGTGLTQIGAPVFDEQGNRYVRGGFSLNLPIGVNNLTSSRSYDAFVAKYDDLGNSLWARQATGSISGITAPNSIEGATALAVDQEGNVYVGGSFVKTITFNDEVGSKISLNDDGTPGVNFEAFLVKYDGDGNLLWARGGNSGSAKNASDLEIGQNGINQIVIDSKGNPILAGFFSGANFLDAATVSAGKTDAIIAQIDPATGAVVWQKTYGGEQHDNTTDLEIDATDELYVVGNYGSPVVEFPTTPTTILTNKSETKNTYVAKLDPSGQGMWVKTIDSPNNVGGSQIAVNPKGEVFLTGYFNDEALFGKTLLHEEEGDKEEEEQYAGLGGYVTKMDTNGEFLWAEGFGGLGESVALDADGRVYVMGKFYDYGTFAYEFPNEETIASFGGVDVFIARYDTNGSFEWAKPVAATGAESTVAIGNTGDPEERTVNSYTPLGIGYNPASDTMFIAGDFRNSIALDCTTLVTDHIGGAYIAELGQDNEETSCRIWNGLDEYDNDFDSADNWNGGILPSDGDSVFVPYTGNDYDPPTFNPKKDITLNNLTMADDRILTLEKELTITGRLDLIGGFVDAETNPLLLLATARTYSVAEGLVLGRVQKIFAPGHTGPFTFPVGTPDDDYYPEYTPIILSNITGVGTFSVNVHRGTYPNTATGLPADRLGRWWNLTNNGLTKADVTFQYMDGDIAGNEALYRAYRIPSGGGSVTAVGSSLNAAANTVTATNITQFSDWTLAVLPPTSAQVSVGGRISGLRAMSLVNTIVSMTGANGVTRTVRVSPMGYYRFEDVGVGQFYFFSVRSKGAQFDPRSITVNDEITDLDFIAK